MATGVRAIEGAGAHRRCMNRTALVERDHKGVVGEDDAAEELSRVPVRSREEDPAAAFEEKELRGWIDRQTDLLPDRYRVVITLFYPREMSYQEIAEVTGLPVGTVKTHLFRAKEMLRRTMENEVPPGPVATDGVRAGLSEGRGGSPNGGAPIRPRALPTGAG